MLFGLWWLRFILIVMAVATHDFYCDGFQGCSDSLLREDHQCEQQKTRRPESTRANRGSDLVDDVEASAPEHREAEREEATGHETSMGHSRPAEAGAATGQGEARGRDVPAKSFFVSKLSQFEDGHLIAESLATITANSEDDDNYWGSLKIPQSSHQQVPKGFATGTWYWDASSI